MNSSKRLNTLKNIKEAEQLLQGGKKIVHTLTHSYTHTVHGALVSPRQGELKSRSQAPTRKQRPETAEKFESVSLSDKKYCINMVHQHSTNNRRITQESFRCNAIKHMIKDGELNGMIGLWSVFSDYQYARNKTLKSVLLQENNH